MSYCVLKERFFFLSVKSIFQELQNQRESQSFNLNDIFPLSEIYHGLLLILDNTNNYSYFTNKLESIFVF